MICVNLFNGLLVLLLKWLRWGWGQSVGWMLGVRCGGGWCDSMCSCAWAILVFVQHRSLRADECSVVSNTFIAE